MAYNGQTFTYDTLGNPTTYKGVNLTWSRGRQLVSYGDKASYTYNVSGIRTSKQVGNTTTNYFLDGTRILAQVDTVTGVDDTTVTTTTEYIYGADGITGFVLEGIPYYYKKNLQGDIIAILDKDLQIVTKYAYDAWGNCKTFYLNNGNFVDIDSTISYTESNAENAESVDYRYIAIKNPFRYRGYYYDVETNLYYLNSRYYDPETGRFITIDDISAISDYMNTFNGLNLYAYCSNNPIMYTDESGRGIFDWILGIFSVVLIVAGAFAVATGVGSHLGGALLSAGINSLVSGIGSYLSGGSFTAGWTGGAITGFLAGFGASFAVGIFMKAINGTSTLISLFNGIGYITSTALSAGIGAFIGTLTTDFINGRDSNDNEIYVNVFFTALLNFIPVYGGVRAAAIMPVFGELVSNRLSLILDLVSEYVTNTINHIAKKWLL